MNKVLVGFLFLLCLLQSLAAEPSVYEGADKQTKEIIKKIDMLISGGKFDSAFQLVAKENKNVYILAKKVEIATNYFAQSINHKMFAFKDLAKGETLDSLRSGKGNFNMYPFDPEQEVNALLKSGERSPILYKALGDYFHDVGRRYQGRWTEDDDSIAKKVADNYDKAYLAGIYSVEMLLNYGDNSMQMGDYPKAVELYGKAIELDSSLLNADFNMAYANLMLKRYDATLAYGEKAIGKYSDDANYRMDAILLCADAAFYQKKYSLSLAYLDKALVISREDYRVFMKFGNVYLGMGNQVKGGENLDALFAFAPTNPSATRMVSEACLAAGNEVVLFEFYKRNLARYSTQPEIGGNLNFHLALQYESGKNKKMALESAISAKENFIKAGKFEGQIQSAVEALIKRNS